MISNSIRKIIAVGITSVVLLGCYGEYTWQKPRLQNTLNEPFVKRAYPSTSPEIKTTSAKKNTPLPSGSIFNETECKKAGGKWLPQMNIDAPRICRIPISDTGKKCTDSSQCDKYCQAPKGTKTGADVIGECSDFSDCSQEVKNGIAQSAACQ